MFDGDGVQSGFLRYPTVSRPVLGKDEGDMLKGWIPDDEILRRHVGAQDPPQGLLDWLVTSIFAALERKMRGDTSM